MPTTLSNPTHRPVKAGVGRYGFRAAQWERARGLASKCKTCGCPHITEAEARVGICERCELEDGSVCSTCAYAAGQTTIEELAADLFTGEKPSEPSLADMIANLEAARERIAKLDAMPSPIQEPEPGEFRCKGCGWLRPETERVTVYVKHYGRVIADLEACRPCSSEVSLCVRG